MNFLLRCLSRPFRKRSGNRENCRGVSTLNMESTSPVVKSEQESGSEESNVRAHLLLRLLGGECYGTVTTSTCEMESTLWSRLPDELLPRVLLMVPFVSKLRFRAVCREWRSLLSSSEFRSETGFPQPSDPPLVCAYRFIHGIGLRDRGFHGADSSASIQASQLRVKLQCRELHLLFPDIHPTDSQGQGCRIDAHVSAQDGILSIEVWKERRLLHGKLRRHRGVPTVLEHFVYLLNPITGTVISMPQLQTEGDDYLGRNLGLVFTKVEPRMDPSSEALFDISSFYWTCWWLDIGMELRQNTSWFTRERHVHELEGVPSRYPDSVHVRDRSGERNLIGIGVAELLAGRFQAVISRGVVYGVHYPHDGSNYNRLFTRTVRTSEPGQGSKWHDEATVPKVNDATDVRFFLVDHRASHSVFYVGQSFHRSGKLTNRICKLQSDCNPLWFWLPISVMPNPVVEDMKARANMLEQTSPMLDGAFVAGDFIILVFRIAGPPPQVSLVAFHVYEETWQCIFDNGPSEELAEFDGFFEVRSNLRFPHDIRQGLKM